MASADSAYLKGKTFSLFGNDADSVSLQRIPWGIYDVGVARAFIGKNTITKTFTMASTIYSSKWAALYLMDEDRPFSLSGKTTIRGDAYVPKSGVQEAYIDGKSYQGDKRLIIGKKYLSDKMLPPLNENRLKELQQYSSQDQSSGNTEFKSDSLDLSFLARTYVLNFKKEDQTPLFPCFLPSFKLIVQRSLLLFCFQHIPTRAALHSKFSAFFTIIPLPEVLPRTFNVQSFPLITVLRYRLTSVKQALHRCTLLLLRDALCPPSTV